MMRHFEAVKVLPDGKALYRFPGMHPGAWYEARSPFDAMMVYVKIELKMSLAPGSSRDSSTRYLLDACGIDSAIASRIRLGQQPLSGFHLLKFSDYSGIPVAELREVACLPRPDCHHNARRAP